LIDGHIILISIESAELDTLKDRLQLISSDGTLLSVTPGFVVDHNENLANQVEQQVCNVFGGDTISPNLVSSALILSDISTRIQYHRQLILVFSEVIDENAFNVTSVRLNALTGTDEYTLTGGNFSRTQLRVIQIDILEEDFNELKNLTTFQQFAGSVQVSLTVDSITDIAKNPLDGNICD
jgi:hypothetical protein